MSNLLTPEIKGKIQELIGQAKRPSFWVPLVLIVLLIGGTIWWWTAREKRHRDAISSRDNLIVALNVKWMACINAPADTIYHPVVIVGGPSQTVYPKPKRLFGVKVDTTKKDSLSLEQPKALVTKETLADECPKGYYNDTTYTDKFAVNWEAMGCIRSFRLLKVSLDHNYMVIKKNQVVIQYDTTFLPEKPPLFRIGIYGDMTLQNFKAFPGLGGGAQAVIKDRVTLGLGMLVMDGVYGNIRIGWLPFKVK